MTPMTFGLFVKKRQPKDGLVGYDILFAYFKKSFKSVQYGSSSPREAPRAGYLKIKGPVAHRLQNKKMVL